MGYILWKVLGDRCLPVMMWSSKWFVFTAARGLPLVAASRGYSLCCCVWASHCVGFSYFGAWALGAQTSVAVAWGLLAVVCELNSCILQALECWLSCPTHVECCWTRDRTHVPCTGRRTPNPWTTRAVLGIVLHLSNKNSTLSTLAGLLRGPNRGLESPVLDK